MVEEAVLEQVAGKLAAVRVRIAEAAQRAGRNPAEVRLLAVSKAQPPAAIEAAWMAGQTAFGESYLQEALSKQTALAGRKIGWHFIGPLQANKTRAVAEHFDWVHSVDRERIARRLAEQRPRHLPPLNICIQVNISGEASKSGVLPAHLPALADALRQLEHVRLRGLMAIPAATHDTLAQRRPFRQLRELQEMLQARGHTFDTLSMGMSDDLEAAIAEGATLVRIGTAIFGARTSNMT
jgi:pyridoxal phosphate enzyme (YggS family)